MYENSGPVPVAPIYKYTKNNSRGFVIDMIHTLQYHIVAHPERSQYILNMEPSFRDDGTIAQFQHMKIVC